MEGHFSQSTSSRPFTTYTFGYCDLRAHYEFDVAAYEILRFFLSLVTCVRPLHFAPTLHSHSTPHLLPVHLGNGKHEKCK